MYVNDKKVSSITTDDVESSIILNCEDGTVYYLSSEYDVETDTTTIYLTNEETGDSTTDFNLAMSLSNKGIQGETAVNNFPKGTIDSFISLYREYNR